MSMNGRDHTQQRERKAGRRAALVFLLLAAALTATETAGSQRLAFTGNVCSLVPANVVASAGVNAHCMLQKPQHRRLYRIVYGASWGNFATRPAHGLFVVVRQPRSAQVLAHVRAAIKAGSSSVGLHAMRNGYFEVHPNAVKIAEGYAMFVAHDYVCEASLYDRSASRTQIQTALLAIANDVANKV
jgi:hypothetical protein